MKIKKSSVSKKVLIVVMLALLVVGVGAYFLLQPKAPKTENDSRSSQSNGDTEKDTDSSPKPSSPVVIDEPSGGQTNDPDTPATSVEAPVIERSSQREGEDNVKIVATLKEPSTGTCEARLTRSGESSVIKKTPVTVGPSYYVCSFSIPVSNFSSSGTWELVVLHQSGSSVANSSVKEVLVTR